MIFGENNVSGHIKMDEKKIEVKDLGRKFTHPKDV